MNSKLQATCISIHDYFSKLRFNAVVISNYDSTYNFYFLCNTALNLNCD